MNSKTKLIISIAIAVIVFVGAILLYNGLKDDYAPDTQLVTPGNNQDSNTTQSSNTNLSLAPDFTVVDENDKEIKLSDYRGKPVVLNMWASWCGYCLVEMPYFQEAYETEKDVQFIMLNMTSGDNIYEARKVLRENGYTFPVLYDTNGSAAVAYNTTSLPVTYFIDKDGNLVGYIRGAVSAEALAEGIEMIK